ncbi:MAG: Hpt domain-containing protein, partial [Burkholderiaceae bacterium]|nr:Hpt domain-containing protein [Burkholderiaceae bacterium]
MNELLEQFLSEARDALEGIGQKLMELERAPKDVELMTQLFRLVHTLKGNSGLFDFPEMTRVLHAGEDLMDAVRHERVGYSEALADRLLDAMDFIGRLCDGIETEQPPDSSVATEAVRLAAGLRQLVTPDGTDASADDPQPAPAPAASTPALIVPTAAELLRIPEPIRLQAWQHTQQGEDLLWVRYQPAEECFFQGEDPLHQARLTPGLLWGGMQARTQPWPALADLDAYRCELDFGLLVLGHRSEVETHFRYVPEQIQILSIPALCLALPQGDPNGGPVYDDFVTDALQFVQVHDMAGLVRTVRLMLELSNSGLWLASALRWLQALLQAPTADWAAIETLVLSVRTLQAPDWVAFLQTATAPEATSSTPAPTAAPIAVATPLPTQEALHAVLAVQREILALPDEDAWLTGRLKAVAASLAPCLYATGRAAQGPALEAATQAALQASSAAPLAAWLESVFPQTETATALVADSAIASPTPPLALEPSPPSDPAEHGEHGEPSDPKMGRRSDEHLSPKSLKVDQVKVDRLMNLIGEMVVAKNAIPYLANRAENQYGVRELAREIKAQYAVINRISEEMQDAIMQVRMMPVSFIFQRFPRLVRDTSR